MNTGMIGSHGNNGQLQAPDLHVQEVIRSAERELNELLQRRAELMKRIGTIKQTLAGLANIFGDSVLSGQLLTFLDRKAASRFNTVVTDAMGSLWRSNNSGNFCLRA